jgi:site-specific recombinase XerD
MKTDLAYWLQRFFQVHLLQQRNVSPATIEAYRDTFRLLLQFLQGKHRRTPSTLSLEAFTAEVVTRFLEHLESDRHNTISTRNARLAALRSFIHYLEDWLGPQLPSMTRRILAIPFKRHAKPMVGYLLREEIEAILAATNDTWTGSRNYLLFLLLYNTGARISEVLNLQVHDVLGSGGRFVQLQGKGRKRRTLPLWPKTRQCLRRWIQQNKLVPEAPLLSNRFGRVLTRSGAAKQLQELIGRAKAKVPSLQKRRISLHQIRHATAMHMLEAGVSAEVIALWLGHESPNTTHGYVEASLAMKRRALAALQSPKTRGHKLRFGDSLLRFLDTL